MKKNGFIFYISSQSKASLMNQVNFIDFNGMSTRLGLFHA